MTNGSGSAVPTDSDAACAWSRKAQSRDRARVVVLGASHWHVPLYRDTILRRHSVVAVQDAYPEAVADADAWGVTITDSVDVALRAGSIDLVYVFSPHNEMASVCLKLIGLGIAFVVEKPLGVRLTEVRSVAAAAQAAGVPATTALVQRAAPIDSWLRRAGTIYYERLSFIAGPPHRYRSNGSAWMLDPVRAGGGALVNLGPHFVDLALQHLGPSTVRVKTRSTAMHHEAVEDHATVVLTAEDGAEAIVEVGYTFPDSPSKRYCSFSAAGSEGFASVDTDGTARFTSRDGASEETTIVVDSDPLYETFVENVADSLHDGFRGMPTIGELIDSMEIIWGSTASELRAL